ncbi:hypothetical protein [Halomonas rhizosphaerae]|uniref:DUF4124 domain-containing protein n=1 Tax=Halomonas rhizosphaerae TaxID=3043296 RepID=A0ABT6UX91_9GAMM|nr:hypothetical protein [Halomonas rhizosphaerae]MDI5890594.1 hypothetical protein [Halomonas rhizosphaerae]
MKLIAIVLLALPLVATAQMKCPDGSYRDRCAGGQGQEFEAPSMSTYRASEDHKRSVSSWQGQEKQQKRQSSSRQATRSGPKPPPDSPMSTAARARDMGISRNELVKAVSRGTVLNGMHRQDVVRILGNPTQVDKQTLGGQRCEHMHWWSEAEFEWVHYIRLCNGRVDHIRQGRS